MLRAWLQARDKRLRAELATQNGLMRLLLSAENAMKGFGDTSASAHEAWCMALLSVPDLYEPYHAAFYRENHRLLIHEHDYARILRASSCFAAAACDVMTALDFGRSCHNCEHFMHSKVTAANILLQAGRFNPNSFTDEQAVNIKRGFCGTWRSRLHAFACLDRIVRSFLERFFTSTARLGFEHKDASLLRHADVYSFGRLHGKVKLLCTEKTFRDGSSPQYKCNVVFVDSHASHHIALGKSDVNYLLFTLNMVTNASLARERYHARLDLFSNPPPCFSAYHSKDVTKRGKNSATVVVRDYTYLEADLLLTSSNFTLRKLPNFNVSYNISLHNPFETMQPSVLESMMRREWRKDLVIVDDAADEDKSATVAFQRLQDGMRKIDTADKYGYMLGYAGLHFMIKTSSNGDRLLPGFATCHDIARVKLTSRKFLSGFSYAWKKMPAYVDLDEAVLNYMERHLLDVMAAGPVNALWLGYEPTTYSPYMPLQFAHKHMTPAMRRHVDDTHLNILLYLQNELQQYATSQAPLFMGTCSGQFHSEIIGNALILAFVIVHRSLQHRPQIPSHAELLGLLDMQADDYFHSFNDAHGSSRDKNKLALAHAVLQAYTQHQHEKAAVARLQIYVRRAVALRTVHISSVTLANKVQLALSTARAMHMTAPQAKYARKLLIKNYAAARLQAAFRRCEFGQTFLAPKLQMYQEMPSASRAEWADQILRDTNPELADLFWRIAFPNGIKRRNHNHAYYCKATAARYLRVCMQEGLRQIANQINTSTIFPQKKEMILLILTHTHLKLPALGPELWQKIFRKTELLPISLFQRRIFGSQNQHCTVPVMPFMYAFPVDAREFTIAPALPDHYYDADHCRNKTNTSFAIPPCKRFAAST